MQAKEKALKTAKTAGPGSIVNGSSSDAATATTGANATKAPLTSVPEQS